MPGVQRAEPVALSPIPASPVPTPPFTHTSSHFLFGTHVFPLLFPGTGGGVSTLPTSRTESIPVPLPSLVPDASCLHRLLSAQILTPAWSHTSGRGNLYSSLSTLATTNTHHSNIRVLQYSLNLKCLQAPPSHESWVLYHHLCQRRSHQASVQSVPQAIWHLPAVSDLPLALPLASARQLASKHLLAQESREPTNIAVYPSLLT